MLYYNQSVSCHNLNIIINMKPSVLHFHILLRQLRLHVKAKPMPSCCTFGILLLAEGCPGLFLHDPSKALWQLVDTCFPDFSVELLMDRRLLAPSLQELKLGQLRRMPQATTAEDLRIVADRLDMCSCQLLVGLSFSLDTYCLMRILHNLVERFLQRNSILFPHATF